MTIAIFFADGRVKDSREWTTRSYFPIRRNVIYFLIEKTTEY